MAFIKAQKNNNNQQSSSQHVDRKLCLQRGHWHPTEVRGSPGPSQLSSLLILSQSSVEVEVEAANGPLWEGLVFGLWREKVRVVLEFVSETPLASIFFNQQKGYQHHLMRFKKNHLRWQNSYDIKLILSFLFSLSSFFGRSASTIDFPAVDIMRKVWGIFAISDLNRIGNHK